MEETFSEQNGQTKHHKIIFNFFQHLDHSYFNMTVNNHATNDR